MMQRTTLIWIAQKLSLECRCQVPHVQMMGLPKAHKALQNYEPGFVKLEAANQQDMHGGDMGTMTRG